MFFLTKIKRFIKNKYTYHSNIKNFGLFSKTVSLENPYRIIGKKNIYFHDNVIIKDGARIEAITKWGKKQIFSPKIDIGENTTFEQDLHLICANSVRIGKDCVFSARVFISDLNHGYKNIDLSVIKHPLEVKEILIEDGCFVGYGACILPGVHLGKHCIVGANAVVSKSFPDYSVIAGNPAKCIKRFSIKENKWVKIGDNTNNLN